MEIMKRQLVAGLLGLAVAGCAQSRSQMPKGAAGPTPSPVGMTPVPSIHDSINRGTGGPAMAQATLPDPADSRWNGRASGVRGIGSWDGQRPSARLAPAFGGSGLAGWCARLDRRSGIATHRAARRRDADSDRNIPRARDGRGSRRWYPRRHANPAFWTVRFGRSVDGAGPRSRGTDRRRTSPGGTDRYAAGALGADEPATARRSHARVDRELRNHGGGDAEPVIGCCRAECRIARQPIAAVEHHTARGRYHGAIEGGILAWPGRPLARPEHRCDRGHSGPRAARSPDPRSEPDVSPGPSGRSGARPLDLADSRTVRNRRECPGIEAPWRSPPRAQSGPDARTATVAGPVSGSQTRLDRSGCARGWIASSGNRATHGTGRRTRRHAPRSGPAGRRPRPAHQRQSARRFHQGGPDADAGARSGIGSGTPDNARRGDAHAGIDRGAEPGCDHPRGRSGRTGIGSDHVVHNAARFHAPRCPGRSNVLSETRLRSVLDTSEACHEGYPSDRGSGRRRRDHSP